MGRKSTLTKGIQAQIVEILEAGNYQKTAYESLGIPEDTYYYWIRTGEAARIFASERVPAFWNRLGPDGNGVQNRLSRLYDDSIHFSCNSRPYALHKSVGSDYKT